MMRSDGAASSPSAMCRTGRRRWRFLLFAVLIALAWAIPGCDRWASNRPLPPIEVYFSPRGGCTEAIVDELDRAESGILVQAYSFTSTPIAKALVQAHKRKVQVQVILDDGQESANYSSADFLLHAGILTLVDGRHAIAHNKVMVIDGQTVITGSFNFTNAAEESNAENLLVIRDPEIAAQYAANWEEHALHSEPYQRKPPDAKASRPAQPKKAKAAAGR